MASAETELSPASIENGLTDQPDSISELFSRVDPLSWTKDELERIVSKNRELRKEFDLDPKKAQAKAKAKIDVSDVKGGSDLLKKLGIEL